MRTVFGSKESDKTKKDERHKPPSGTSRLDTEDASFLPVTVDGPLLNLQNRRSVGKEITLDFVTDPLHYLDFFFYRLTQINRTLT
jgi:hypothetical protein